MTMNAWTILMMSGTSAAKMPPGQRSKADNTLSSSVPKHDASPGASGPHGGTYGFRVHRPLSIRCDRGRARRDHQEHQVRRDVPCLTREHTSAMCGGTDGLEQRKQRRTWNDFGTIVGELAIVYRTKIGRQNDGSIAVWANCLLKGFGPLQAQISSS